MGVHLLGTHSSSFCHFENSFLHDVELSTFSTPTLCLLDGSLRQLARLLVCNFRALEHGYGEADAILQALRDLPIIPLADGHVVALSKEGVFFPMEESKTKKNKAQAQTGNFTSVCVCVCLHVYTIKIKLLYITT